ncbi:ribosomal protection-like ABC-F family protein [Bacillus sp. T33-2]|uniref:ribosomal protection-like ABC-F family protein n=1 Tax=Bacillus sp. T33-2 TaxID=2054168 RepID=UPI000C7930F1|nr:ABC-F type ribosomal protection protein [Bacillus sp. T33-2]PLR98797.1 ABC transporter ATP-binding protein [Bacillus sp. T33-2]
MAIMKIRDVQKNFGDKCVLKHATFEINRRSRIGLVGNNGTGKTTLASIIYGSVSPDKGSVEVFEGPVKIGFLMQSTEYTVNDYYDMIYSAEKELFEEASQLGLARIAEWDEERFSHLSGGEKLKLSLAKIWASKPDLLILDEPTNHLDLKGMEWLVNEMASFSGAIIVISHDRHFLDRTVQQIVELEDGTTRIYNGNYTFYRLEKERQYNSQLHNYEIQKKHKERIEQQITNLKNWSEKAHIQSTKQGSASERRQIGFKEYHRVKAKKMDNQIKSKLKRLDAELEKNRIEKPNEQQKVNFQFEKNEKRGRRIIEVQNLDKCFGKRQLFRGSDFYINHGERIGIVGDNGSGKTTLLKILQGVEPVTKGKVWMSESLKMGYLSQDVTDLDSKQTILEHTGLIELSDINDARTIFAGIGLSGDKVNQKIETLSLGERTRAKLAAMLLRKVDLLILDEPTNHLDLGSRESFEKMLTDFSGSILAVSHDQYFLQKICDKLLVLQDKTIRRVEMGIKEFKEHNSSLNSNDSSKNQLLLIQNEITALIGQLCMLDKNDPEYKKIDNRLDQLMKQKKLLTVN